MNSDQAKKISIISYLKTLGKTPEKVSSGSAYFLSPFRDEKKASFKVDINKNLWFDYGIGRGGKIIDLCMLMNNTDIKGALHILSNQNASSFFSHKQEPIEIIESQVKIKHIQELQNKALLQYIESRKIPIEIAKIYVKEMYYTCKNLNLFSVCFENDNGGFELRNKLETGKVAISPKYYTTISGENKNSLNIFEGFFNFLSALTYYKTNSPGNDTIILNSLAMLNKILPILPKYTTLNLFMDNDEAGKKAVQTINEHHSNTKNQSLILFPNCKDFNEFICS